MSTIVFKKPDEGALKVDSGHLTGDLAGYQMRAHNIASPDFPRSSQNGKHRDV
jgi:hypothetical protein